MRARRGAVVIACAVLLPTGTGCGSTGTAESPATIQAAGPEGVRLYGTDGTMSNTFGAAFEDKPGLIAGMKGTAPLSPLAETFRSRLLSVDADLREFAYAAESYDAVVITALATELANTTRPRRIAAYVNGVTTGGEPCDSVSTCLALARDDKDLRYRGASLTRGGFTDAGEPAAASYATLHFGDDDRLDEARTEFVGAGDETATTTQPAPKPGTGPTSGAPLKIGGLLPRTGALADRHPPMLAGAQLAVQEINAAGGVLGQPVEWLDGDDGTDPVVARRTVADHVDAGVHVIIGAGASGVTRAVLPDVVKARRMLFSPSNTAEDLSTMPDDGMYFRTAPSDRLQGQALADVIMRDGVQRIAVVARDDAYGRGMQETVRANLERAGLDAAGIRTLTYPAGGATPADLDRITDYLTSFRPHGVLIIGYTESAPLIKMMAEVGLPLRH